MLTARLYSGFNATAKCKGHSGALAYWLLSRALDKQGAGRVTAAEVKQAAMGELGWSLSKHRRAYNDALKLGLIMQGRNYIYLTGLVRTAKILNIETLGHSFVELPAAKVLKTSMALRSALWAAFHTGRPTQPRKKFSAPIARETLKELSSVGRKTQVRYEKRHNAARVGQVKKQTNYQILHGLQHKDLQAAREFVHPACFMYYGQVAKPLPNSYQSQLKSGRGRLKKANRSLRSLVCIGAGANAKVRKVFYTSAEEWLETVRREQTKPKNRARLLPLSALVGYKVSFGGARLWASSSFICPSHTNTK